MPDWQTFICGWVAIGSLAVIILVLRDTRFRISMRVLLILVAFSALGLCASKLMVDGVRFAVENKMN